MNYSNKPGCWRVIWRSIARNAPRFFRWTIGGSGFWWILGVLGVIAIGGCFSWIFRGDLTDTKEPLSTTIRNLALVIGGVVAVLLAMWRSLVAGRQAETAEQSLETARQSLRNERYQQGAAMLGSRVLAVRLGGIYALSRLAASYAEEYHVQAMEILCAFARNPTQEQQDEVDESTLAVVQPAPLREDIQTVLTTVGQRSDDGLAIDDAFFYWPDLHRAELTRANLYAARLMNANLRRTVLANARLIAADLSEAWCQGADFREADLTLAQLPGAKLGGADVSGAKLKSANLSGTVFSEEVLTAVDATPELVHCIGLTQAQLDEARKESDPPPVILPGLVDAETGAPLVWRGESQ